MFGQGLGFILLVDLAGDLVETGWDSNLAEACWNKALGLIKTLRDKALVMFHLFGDRAVCFFDKAWDLVETCWDNNLAEARWDKTLGSVETCWNKALAVVHSCWDRASGLLFLDQAGDLVETCWDSNLAGACRDKALGVVNTVWDEALVMFHLLEIRPWALCFLGKAGGSFETSWDSKLAEACWDKAVGLVKTVWDKGLVVFRFC